MDVPYIPRTLSLFSLNTWFEMRKGSIVWVMSCVIHIAALLLCHQVVLFLLMPWLPYISWCVRPKCHLEWLFVFCLARRMLAALCFSLLDKLYSGI